MNLFHEYTLLFSNSVLQDSVLQPSQTLPIMLSVIPLPFVKSLVRSQPGPSSSNLCGSNTVSVSDC